MVPIVHLHGTEDETVSYDNGVGSPGWGTASVPDIIGHWTGLMGTTTLEETALPNQEAVDATSVDFFRHAGASGGQEFHHYRVNGGGHDWFGVWGSPDVDATAVLWDFFSAQCNGEFTGIEGAPIAQSLIERQGPGVLLRSTGRIDLFDLQGRWVGTRQMALINCGFPPEAASGCSAPPPRTGDRKCSSGTEFRLACARPEGALLNPGRIAQSAPSRTGP